MGILNVTPDSFADGGADARSRAPPSTRRCAMEARRRRHHRRRRRVDAARAPSRSPRPRSSRACCRWSRRSPGGCASRFRSTPTRPRSRARRSTRARRSSTTSAACGTTRRWRASSPTRGAALVLMHTRGRSDDMYARGGLRRRRRRRSSASCAASLERAADAGVPRERLIVDPGRRVCQTAGAQLWCAGAARRSWPRRSTGRCSSGRRASRSCATALGGRAGDRARLGHGRGRDRRGPRRRAHRPRARRGGDGAGRPRRRGDTTGDRPRARLGSKSRRASQPSLSLQP